MAVRIIHLLKGLMVGLGCAGLVLPAAAFADEPASTALARNTPVSQKAPAIQDVALDRDGSMRGLVVDVQGTPIAHAAVTAESQGRELARSETDGLGRFTLGPLGGGIYQLKVGGQGRLVRLWADQTAPPAARQMVLVVLGGKVVRGQLPFEAFCASDTFVIMGMVAAAVAIPIAVHNGGGPSSPP